MSVRKAFTIALVALMLPVGSVGASSPASAMWLVRGYPLHVGYHRFYHRGYAYRGFYRGYYGRHLRSPFFLHCAGVYGVPVC